VTRAMAVLATCHACGRDARVTAEEQAAGRAECPMCGAMQVFGAAVATGEGPHRSTLSNVPTTALVPAGDRLVQQAGLRSPEGLTVGSEGKLPPRAAVFLGVFVLMVGLHALLMAMNPSWKSAVQVLSQLLLWAPPLFVVRHGLQARFGKVRLTVQDAERRGEGRMGFLSHTRRLALTPVTTIEIVRAERPGQIGKTEWVVDVVTDGRRLEIGRGAGLREDEAAWIAEAVRAEVAALRKALPPR